jgi:quinol---cytochrome c reductase iron-sulfur subunit, bacillus type
MEKPALPRRGFLATLTWGIGALIGAGFAVPAIAYVVGPALKKAQEGEWIPLGSTSKVEIGLPTLFNVTVERKAGWIVDQEKVSIFVLTTDGRDYIAMSNICTHLGCRVRWIADQKGFFCPCHNAVFDAQGQVVSGPPPRALDRYEVKIDGDQLSIRGV